MADGSTEKVNGRDQEVNGHVELPNDKNAFPKGTMSSDLPIVIAGGGCVGLFLAHLLCRSEVPNRVIIIEPSAPDATVTRAMAHQPIAFPLFAGAGLLEDMMQLGSLSAGLCFRASASSGSKLIAGKQFAKGDKAQLLLPQGLFQLLLMRKVQESGKGEVKLGWTVTGFAETGNDVEVQIQNVDGNSTESIPAAYLIGADGAHSSIRKAMGLSFDGVTLPTQLVATDIKFDFTAHGFYDANFVIDEVDYGLIGRIDEKGLWRVSYGVPGTMSEEEIRNSVGEKLRMMLPDAGKDGYEVKRVAPYKAQQRCVDRLWKGRVGVVGDAAHLTNPYAGLGLASGIADASSLSSVLTRILSGQATDPATLLGAWSDDRRDKYFSAVDKPSRMAHARVQTKLSSEEDVKRLMERDPLVGALSKGMPVMPPQLGTDVEGLKGWA